jgi:hypothetical protein
VTRAADLRSDYDTLGALLATAEGSAAASIARERRIIGEILEQLEDPEEVSLVDELAARRSGTGTARPPARRRQS